MSLVVTGSLAFDHIMVFQDEFQKHILPDKVHMLNVSFMVDELSQESGGTAGNIAYSLSLLDEKPLVVGTVGKDFSSYAERIREWGLTTDFIKVLEDEYTAQAFITTDQRDNQITAFHGGAMFRAHEQDLGVLDGNDHLVIISPNGIQAMVDHAQHCRQQGWRFWFDPGQALPAFSGEQLASAIDGADGLLVNDYEWTLFKEKTSLDASSVLALTACVIVTKGPVGVEIISSEKSVSLPAVPNIEPVDPTGAGDAFRAGLLHSLQKGDSIEEACRMGCAVASFAVEKKGTQNHQIFKKDLVSRKAML